MGGQELEFIHDAFDSNYITPVGPQVNAFEREFAEVVGARHAARDIFDAYVHALRDLPGAAFMPEPEGCRSTRWLTCLTIDPVVAGTDRDAVIKALKNENIEFRPTWKPMHLQPLYQDCEVVGGAVFEYLFEQGICLPSGMGMSEADFGRVVRLVRGCWEG